MQGLPPLEAGRSTGVEHSDAPDWQSGQKLNALVIRGAGAGGRAVIRIGRAELLAVTRLPLVKGERLAIEVSRVKPQLSLRVTAIEEPPAEAQAATGENALARSAIQNLAPRQNALGPVLTTLIDARNHAGDDTAPAIRTAVAKLLDNLPDINDVVDPAGLRRAITQATAISPKAIQGNAPPALRTLMLEVLRAADQAAGDAQPPRDIAIPPAPPPPNSGTGLNAQAQAAAIALAANDQRTIAAQLRNLLDGALARGALHQLSTNLQSTGNAPVICGELPVRNGNAVDIIPFRIRRENARREHSTGQHTAASWKVSLALNLPGIGALYARLTLAGRDVSARFWTADKTVRQTIDCALPTLADALDRCGLKAAHLSCHTGNPPVDSPPASADESAHLLDTRA